MRSLCWLLAIQAVGAPTGSDVRGKIVLKTGELRGYLEIRAGASGGEVASLPIEDAQVPMFKTFGSVSWDETAGLTFHYKNLVQGTRLITVAWILPGAPNARKDTRRYTHYVESRWVEARPPESGKTSTEAVLTLDPAVSGDVNVTLAAGVDVPSVSFLPCNAEGRIPHWEDPRTGPAFSEQIREGKAVFKGMKPGKYVFFPTPDPSSDAAPAVQGFVEVKEKTAAAVTLAPAEK